MLANRACSMANLALIMKHPPNARATKVNTMHHDPDVPVVRVAAFIRQYVHDLRNTLTCVGLEMAVLKDLVADPEATHSLVRLRRHVRAVEDELRSLSTLFQEPRPVPVPIPARELLDIWSQTHEALTDIPAVRWMNMLKAERVAVDTGMLTSVFAELLINAGAFSTKEPLTVTGERQGERVVFELREPKRERMDTTHWGELFYTTQRGRSGLGLWAARRAIEAHAGTLDPLQTAEGDDLVTRISLPLA